MIKRRELILEAVLLVAASILLGLGYTFTTKQGFFAEQKPGPPAGSSNLEMISVSTAREAFETKTGIFIDARHEFEYRLGHIPGSRNIPLNEYTLGTARLAGIGKGDLLIVYCDGTECNSSIELAAHLAEAGYSNVKIFFGGWQEWNSARLPVESK